MIRRPRNRSVDFGPKPTRALSEFVAVNARYPSQWLSVAILAGAAAVGYELAGPQGILEGLAVGAIIVWVLLPLWQRASQQGRSVLNELNRMRRSVGLENALSNEQIAALEPAARQWERIENAMLSTAWRGQPDWRGRVSEAARVQMERYLVAVLRNRPSDDNQRLVILANAVDRVTASMGAYPRPEFDASGVPVGLGQSEVAELDKILKEIDSLV